jgi:metallo-beta-lactamase family protein
VGTPGRVLQKYGPQGGYVELDAHRDDINVGVRTLPDFPTHADEKV